MKLITGFNVLLPLALVMGLGTGCTGNNKTKDADRREGEANAQSAKATEMQQKYESELASAQKMSADNKKAADALSVQVADFNTKHADRERMLLDLQEQVAGEDKIVADLKSQQTTLKAYIASEQTRIATERTVLQQKQDQTKAELTELRASTDVEITALKAKANSEVASVRKQAARDIESKNKAFSDKAAALEKRIAEANAHEVALKALQENLDQQSKTLASKDQALAKLEASLAERSTALQESIKTTREFFMKQAIGDVFERIDAQKKYVFLVNVIGVGSTENALMIRKKIESLNEPTSKYVNLKTVTNLNAEAKAINTVKDSFLVETKAQSMRALREEVEAQLQGQSKAGESIKLNSLWMVIRPIERVRVGLKLLVRASDTKYYDGRNSQVIATFENIHSAEQGVFGIENLDLTKPGSYIFKKDANAKICESVGEECLAALVSEGFLDAVQTMNIESVNGKASESGSYRELLARLMVLSNNQSREDLKDKPILGITLDKFDNTKFTFDTAPLMDKFNFASRAPVIDSISIVYTVSLVETINPVANHMDSAQYLFSGIIGNTKMYDLSGKVRGEIAIPLPIAQFKESRTKFMDLSLKDFKPTTELPTKSAELIDLEKITNWYRPSEQRSRFNKLTSQFEADLKSAQEKLKLEKQNEFEDRTFANAGLLKPMINALMKKK